MFVFIQGGYVVEEVDPVIADDEFERVVEPLLQEYMQTGIASEVEVRLLNYCQF